MTKNPYLRIQISDPVTSSILNRIQSAIYQAFSSIIGPFISGNMISNTQIGTSQTQVAHKLGYAPNNIFLGCPNASSTVYSSQASDANFIYLTASATCTLNIWVS